MSWQLFLQKLDNARWEIFLSFIFFSAAICLVPVITYIFFTRDLGSKDRIMNKKNTGVVLLDMNNRPFFSFYQGKITSFVPLSQIPKYTTDAMIASEDKDFYYHPGFSIKSIIRSLIIDFKSGDLSYGGSTITQQLVKNSLLTPNKSFLRKFQEIVLANEIERRYSKNEILEIYANSVYFGEGAFGVEEAAQIYFGKETSQLDLAQSAFLAAILPAPAKLSPDISGLGPVEKRQDIILSKMMKDNYITKEQKDAAEKEKLVFRDKPTDLNNRAVHFALMVRDELVKKYGEEQVARSGFKIKTTLNLDWQDYAENTVAAQVKALKPNGVSNGAAVVMDPKTGEVRVLVGSSDWYDDKFGKVNMAISPRSPGSSFKAVVYTLAFEKRLITPVTTLHDLPTLFANFDDSFYSNFPTRAAALAALAQDPNAYYKPVDFDRKYRGNVTVRRALANSLNIPAVEVMKKIGVKDVMDFAKSVGINSLKDPSNYGLALVLGAGEVRPLELTDFYATLANKGMMNEPTLISEITDKTNQVVYKYQPTPKRAVSEGSSFLTTSILSDNDARAEEFGNALTISRPAAVKTGTAEDFKDAWTIGFTPSLVVGVWVGNNDNKPMDNIAGSLGAAPIWRSLMEKFLVGTPVETFAKPAGVVKTNVCGNSSDEYFLVGTEELATCSPKPFPSTAGPSSTPSPTKHKSH